MRHVMPCVVAVAVLLAAVPAIARAPYDVIDLGTLGGAWSSAVDINEGGVITGYAATSMSVKHAVFWDEDGHIVDLGVPDGFTISSAGAVNDAGQMLVSASDGNGTVYQQYLVEDGIWTPIEEVVGLVSFGAADINNAGQIIGTSSTYPSSEPFPVALLWEDGSWTVLGTLGGDTSPGEINEVGQVVGSSQLIVPDGAWSPRAFLWEDDVMTDLGVIGDDFASSARDINDYGDIVGVSTESIGPIGYQHDRAVVWPAGVPGPIELGHTPDSNRTCGGSTYPSNAAAAVNNHGQVVGSARCIASGGALAAFLYQDGAMYNLNDLIPSGSGWDLVRATDINDAGQIIGYGVHHPYDDTLRAFLLDPLVPCSEPSECDDGLYCNGVEECLLGVCRDGSSPCPGQVCDEDTATCEPFTCDNDLACELGESCVSCPSDCAGHDGSQWCGDGFCQPGNFEDCVTCPSDCNGRLKGNAQRRFCCGADVDCTDVRCDSDTWFCDDAQPYPFCCGDGVCDPGEDECGCPVDCGGPEFPDEFECADGIDNDCDGFIDDTDSDCCGQPDDPCYADMDCCSGRCKNNNKWPFLGTCR